VSYSARDTLGYLQEMSEPERQAIGARARQRVLRHHTAAHRAQEVEQYVGALTGAIKNLTTLQRQP
jgi:predicted Zn-dependent protease